MGGGGRKSPKGATDAFENPVALDDSGAFEQEKDGEVESGAFENESAANISRGTESTDADDNVLPESLDALEGSQQCDIWKESLVEHVVERKENARDRARRKAQAQLQDSRILDPDGRFRRQWDLAQMVLLTYVAFVVPYRLGFSHPVLLWSPWFWFDACVDLYFISDIFMSCSTAFYDDTGALVVNGAQIRRQYVRTWALIDVSSCFPGNYISYALEDGTGSSSSKSIKLLRMLRLLKLLRLARINRLIQKYEEEFAAVMTTMKLAKLIIVIIVVGHWLSCLFFFFGSLDLDDPTLDTGLDENGEATVGWVSRQFSAEHCGQEQCRWQKYLTSFYWAVMTMTTVGYGDIVPATKYEMFACIISMTVGGFVFGMIVGNLAELSKRANAGELMRQEAVGKVQMILDSGVAKGSLPKGLSRRIKMHYGYMLERKTALDINSFVLQLPPQLRDQMAESLHWVDGVTDGHEVFGLLHKIPFFFGLSNEACIHICAQMKCLFSNPPIGQRELIMEEGADAEEMYIVIEGTRSVLLEASGVQLGALSTGDFFGELGALLPPTVAELRKRRRSAYATGATQLGMITHSDLMKFRKEFMEINEKVVAFGNQVLEHLQIPGDVDNETAKEHTGPRVPLSVLDPHPELRALEQKLDLILSATTK